MNFENEIIKLISESSGISEAELAGFTEKPANSENGDFAFPCFRLAKTMRKSPQLIASEIAEKIKKPDFIEKIEVVNAYINFFVNKSSYIKEVMDKVLTEKENYGKSNEGNGKTIVIDYSSPNIAKPFHVGHLRSTVIGNALYKIYSALGYKCIGINHLGDWGTQFGKLIVAYKMWGNKEVVEKEGVKELSRIYVKFHEEAEKDEKLNNEARGWLVKMQNGDEEALSLWKWFCDISMKEFQRVYDKLNIKFDYYTGESFYNDKMQAVVEEIKQKNLLTESEGAKIVDLEKYNMSPCLILRSDGGTLYPTRDISAVLYRKKEYNFSKCLYVTALDQNLHFAQWFKVVELMGYEWAKDELVHIPFGLVNLADGKLSTRQGRVVLMEEVLDFAIEKTRGIMEEKNAGLDNKEEIAKQVGIGAVIFNDLFNSRIKNVIFDTQKMISFEGETGPYAQYTHARACSILRKESTGDISTAIDYSLITDDASFNVCKILSEFNGKIKDSANKNEPYILTRYIIELCQAFNNFYNENNIKESEGELKKSRIAVVYAVKTVIASALSLLGIEAPEQM